MQIDFIDLKSQYAKIENDLRQDFDRILSSCQFIMGPEIQKCEENLQSYTGAKYALTCSSGTDALIIALMSLGIGCGDEVIVPAFTFFATASAVTLVGAKPIFVDVQKESFNICPDSVRENLSPNTKAVIAVGLYGQLADMGDLEKICEEKKLVLIEDAAQSFGATVDDRKSCSLTKVAATSFFPAKPLGCYGDGGAAFTSDEDLYDIMKQIRVHGDRSRYEHVRIGINGRMDALQCAVINHKLRIFDWEIEQRNLVAQRYEEALRDLKQIQLPKVAENKKSVWAQYTVLVENRNQFQAALKERGIPTSVHYPIPVYKQDVYKKHYQGLHLDNTEYIAPRVVSLPMHPYMDSDTQVYICEKVKEVLSS